MKAIKFFILIISIAAVSACTGTSLQPGADGEPLTDEGGNIVDTLPPSVDTSDAALPELPEEPELPDTDNDGEPDDTDTDDDNDGVEDAVDPDPLNENICGDEDGDTCDDCTNGPKDINNDGPDSNNDGICDAGEADTDTDGVIDMDDNCPDIANADQADADTDGVGDACDNCPAHANENQANKDGDDFGNVCDADKDDDDICDDLSGTLSDADTCTPGPTDGPDNCPYKANPGQEDEDNDGKGDACEFPMLDLNLKIPEEDPWWRSPGPKVDWERFKTDPWIEGVIDIDEIPDTPGVDCLSCPPDAVELDYGNRFKRDAIQHRFDGQRYNIEE